MGQATLKMSREELIQLHERFLNDQVLKSFTLERARILERSVPKYIVKDTYERVYDDIIIKVLESIDKLMAQHISSSYPELIKDDEGFIPPIQAQRFIVKTSIDGNIEGFNQTAGSQPE